MGVNSLPKTVTRQFGGCDLNPGPSASESSALATRLPSHLFLLYTCINHVRHGHGLPGIEIQGQGQG